MTTDVSRRNRVLILALAVTAAAGCTQESTPSELVVPVFSQGADHSTASYGTHMTGAEETPARPSKAQGQLILTPQEDGTALAYKLVVANIENAMQAHIHLAAPGVAGPVIAWLYPSAPPAVLIPGRFNGVLAEGVITNANVVGPLAGQGLAALVAAIKEGNAYANVHTSQFPPGEIRGQVR